MRFGFSVKGVKSANEEWTNLLDVDLASVERKIDGSVTISRENRQQLLTVDSEMRSDEQGFSRKVREKSWRAATFPFS